ncbi:hypothetical protein BV25DRAFT_1947112 [Artomyces pyxidatus]|uniref:Uncharacterized protein n=1 Tax=Artomyces pyxidatus TaxID=48021 RepID=A0ACB8T085_9AGAM|nr:hypothetical protein BV25DRAFT_1947112 [Artomyces pyxidatus]
MDSVQKKLPKPTIITSKLPQHLFEELSASIKGQAYNREDAYFTERTRLFNGNVVNASKAVVLPLDAEDVSKIVLFCNKYSLSPSIKAGGYGTGGWAINGDLVVDLSLIRDIGIEPPQQTESGYTSLWDTRGNGRDGPSSAGELPSSSLGAKRRLNDEDAGGDDASDLMRPGMTIPNTVRVYDSASAAVASFLHGPALPADTFGETPRMPPLNRRRLNIDGDAAASIAIPVEPTRHSSNDSNTSQGQSSDSGTSSLMGRSTSGESDSSLATNFSPKSPPQVTTPPSAQPGRSNHASPSPASEATTSRPRADPFAYMTDEPAFTPSPPAAFSAQVTLGPSDSSASLQSSTIWGPSAAPMFTHPLFTPADVPSHLAQGAPVHPHAFVSFGAGVRQKEVDTYTAGKPLAAGLALGGATGAVPYHVPFSAHPVGSSVMLLGGFGFLSRMHGLSIDNLVEVEMVLADGRIVIINEREYPDLRWAVRSGGAALGIATRYKAFAGNVIYRFHRATAASLMKPFRDCVKGAPREPCECSLVVVQMCYVGAKKRDLESLQVNPAWNGERCLLSEVSEKAFLNQQDSIAQVLGDKAGNQWFIRKAMATSLADNVINKTVIELADTPIGCTWLFELAGGAIADFENNCVPKKQREASFTIAALHQWDMSIDDPRCVETAEEWLRDTIGHVAVGGPFPSFLGRHEPPERVMASFGENWSRLATLKRKYDPMGFFKNTFWPLSADGEAVDPRTHEPATP